MSPKLSICISTLNRASFIGATLESVIGQATSECEIVVLDAASTDGTDKVVAHYCSRFENLRYVRQENNNGLDRDFDRAVELARGRYCWLLSDDDILKPGAIAAVIEAIRQDYSLILVNAEGRDLGMSRVLSANFFGISSDRVYMPADMDRLYGDIGRCLVCICCIIIKREIWLRRQRAQFYGSMFLHIGVIFQEPLPGLTLVMAEPLLGVRWGNQKTWEGDAFEIFFVKWPKVVWSLALADATKYRHCSKEPWRRARHLLPMRAGGDYSWVTYNSLLRRHLHSARERLVPLSVLLIPRSIARILCALQSWRAGRELSSERAAISNSMFPESVHEALANLNK
jgi:glycosyltransferase involved in cell wall biosynthesis